MWRTGSSGSRAVGPQPDVLERRQLPVSSSDGLATRSTGCRWRGAGRTSRRAVLGTAPSASRKSGSVVGVGQAVGHRELVVEPLLGRWKLAERWKIVRAVLDRRAPDG